MSIAAKVVIIKAVAQALPTYVMSIFKLPLGLCDDLTSIIREFWWGVENGKRKTAWIAWDEMLMKKCCGGMGSIAHSPNNSLLQELETMYDSLPCR